MSKISKISQKYVGLTYIILDLVFMDIEKNEIKSVDHGTQHKEKRALMFRSLTSK